MKQVEVHQDINGGNPITTTYGYDDLNRLTSVSYSTGGALAYTYDNAGNRLTEIGADPSNPGQPVNLTYHYDAINRLTSITDNLDSTQDVTFTYDDNGNRTSKTVAGVTTTYAYNILDELVQTTAAGGGAVEFDYDYTGMRISTISAAGTIGYYYDSDGNLLLEYAPGGQVAADTPMAST